MVVEKKSGDFKTVEIRLPSWMYSKVALAVMVAVIIIGFVYMTPGINTAVFGTNAKTSQDAQTEVKTPAKNAVVNVAVTVTVAEFYAKHKELILAAHTPTITLEKMFSINSIPKEIPLGQGLFLLNLKITEKEITGIIENRDTRVHGAKLKILGFKGSGNFVYVSDIIAMGAEETVFGLESGQQYLLSIRPEGFYIEGRSMEFGLKDTKFLAIAADVAS